jgi:hypothetical protein
MRLSRRSFLATAGAALSTAAAKPNSGLHIGVTDWNLEQTGKLDAVTLAKSLGFEGGRKASSCLERVSTFCTSTI